MRTREPAEETRPETVLLMPFAIALVGLLVYVFVEILPRVRGLPG